MSGDLSGFLIFIIAVLLTGCGRRAAHEDAHDHSAATSHRHHEHDHTAPHGGTIVVLGEEQFHLEFVHSPETGKLTAYILDGELEEFIRVAAESFEVVANPAGRREVLEFRAVANRATGETVGDTAQFEAQAEWLKNTTMFEAVLTSVSIRGTPFAAVAFNFPAGNEPD